MSMLVTVSIVSPKTHLFVFYTDKENINPVTSHRASVERESCKKRKTCALSTKLYTAPPTKKQKESRDGKSCSTLVPVEVPKQDAKKKRVGVKRCTTYKGSSRMRRAPSFPKVLENAEVEAALSQCENMSQVLIDARCWELTVLPLADLSKAYTQAPSQLEEFSPAMENEEAVLVPAELRRSQQTKDALAETIAKERIHSRKSTPEPTRAASPAVNAPSTPEPQPVFSVFNFSLPPPSGERYALFHTSTVERFLGPEL